MDTEQTTNEIMRLLNRARTLRDDISTLADHCEGNQVAHRRLQDAANAVGVSCCAFLMEGSGALNAASIDALMFGAAQPPVPLSDAHRVLHDKDAPDTIPVRLPDGSVTEVMSFAAINRMAADLARAEYPPITLLEPGVYDVRIGGGKIKVSGPGAITFLDQPAMTFPPAVGGATTAKAVDDSLLRGAGSDAFVGGSVKIGGTGDAAHFTVDVAQEGSGWSTTSAPCSRSACGPMNWRR